MATCNAGHGCIITCPNGCGAIYTEPNGPCRTMCSGQEMDLSDLEGMKFSIHISDFPVESLRSSLRTIDFPESINEMTGRVNLEKTGVTLDQLGQLIAESIR